MSVQPESKMWNGIKRLWHSLAHVLGVNRCMIETLRSKNGFLVMRVKCVGCGRYVTDYE